MAGGGNQVMQPYLSSYKKKFRIFGTLQNTNIIHDYGYYIGNYPNLDKHKIKKICNIINSL